MAKRLLVSGLIGLGVSLTAGLLIFFGPLDSINNTLTDAFLYRTGEARDDITIIGIDDASLDPEGGLGRYSDWPRSYYAQAIENILKYEPKAIGIDVDFSVPSSGLSSNRVQKIVAGTGAKKENAYYAIQPFLPGQPHPDDQDLANVLHSKEIPIVMAVRGEFVTREGALNVADFVLPLPQLRGENVSEGFINFLPDDDNVLREIAVMESGGEGGAANDAANGGGMKLLAYELFERTHAVPQKIPAPRKIPAPPIVINYKVPPYGFNSIPFANAMADGGLEEAVRGKYVLIGATAPILHDAQFTPLSLDTPMPGVEVHANILQMFLTGDFLSAPSRLADWWILTLLAVAGAVFFGALPVLFSALALFALAAFYLGAAWLLFEKGILFGLVNPIVALLAVYAGVLIYRYLSELREKRKISHAFSHYINKEVMAEILRHPEQLHLGGDKRRITILFSDIQNFTGFAEGQTPENLVTQLNEYMDVMSSAVLEQGGMLDKFEGDAIMAFFGAPVARPDAAIAASKAALQMRQLLPHLHQHWNVTDKPLLEFRVGLATGDVIVGNLGSKTRFDYTVVGDAVNLAARLETANKSYGTRIMVDEETFRAVESQIVCRKLDKIRVKGKQEAVAVYEVLGAVGDQKAINMDHLHDFAEGLLWYSKRDYAQAAKYFQQILKSNPNDMPAQIYLNRCAQFVKNPPPKEWDGVFEV